MSVALNGTVIAAYPYLGYVSDITARPFATADATLFVTGTNVLVFEILNLGGATAANFLGLVSYETGPSLPTSKDQCKHGGWQTFGVFKNQGDCVSFVATGGKNQPAN